MQCHNIMNWTSTDYFRICGLRLVDICGGEDVPVLMGLQYKQRSPL